MVFWTAFWTALWAKPAAPGLCRVPVFVLIVAAMSLLTAFHSSWWFFGLIVTLGVVAGLSRTAEFTRAGRETHA